LAKEIWGNFSAQDVVVQGISGSTLELIINGYTSATTEVYSVSNSSIVSDGGTTNVPVTGVTISNCPAANLVVGGTVDLASTIAPANATNKAVVWSSSNTTVATVDVSNGLVTALAAGTAVMTVETGDGNKTATCTINVDSAPVCSNWTDANFSVTNTTKNYNSGLIDISCASSVTLSMDISENSSLENEDVVKVSYILDNNAEVVFWNQMNDFAPKAISIPNLSGSKITVKVYVITNDSQETINVSNLKITIDGLKSASASSGAKISQSQETLSVNEKLLSSTMVKVYPNPVSGTLNINSEGSSENVINVFNALGQLVFSTKSNKTDTQIDIQSLNLSGVVIVQVIADGTVSNHKVIVK